MEYGYSVDPSHVPVYDEHPQRSLYDDEPTNTMVMGDEEEHHEEKIVLESVKDKVKKMEDIMTKHTNGGDDDKVHDDHSLEEEGEGYHKDDEYMEVNPEVHGVPMYTGVLGGRDKPIELNPDELGVSPDVVSTLQAMAISEQPEVQQRDQQRKQTQSGHEDESQMGHVSSDVEKKPSYTKKLSLTAAAAKDAAVSAASMVYSKIAGTVSGQPGEPTRQTPVETPKKPSYTERLSSTAAAAKDVAVSTASTVYAKVAGKEEGTQSGETHNQVEEMKEGDAEMKGRYTEKLSSTALVAKDAAVSAASTVYGKLAGDGNTVTGQTGGGTEQDKGVSMREYLAEKLRPGEGDRALCEVISESMKKSRVGEEVGVGEKNKVAGWDGTIGEGMVEKVRDAVTSLVGRDGAGSGASPPVAETPPGERTGQE